MIGRKVNRLTVLSFNGFRDTKKGRIKSWLCRCDCGNEVIATTGAINFGSVKSCGCLKTESLRERLSLKEGEASFRQVYKSYKQKAKDRNIDFYLTKDEFLIITSKRCFYCNSSPNNISKSRSATGDYIYNGIDRIDNSIGYNLDNCVACCKRCNVAKNDMSLKEFKDMIISIYSNFILGGK